MTSTDSDSFARLMTGLENGDEAAAAEVFGRFVRRLVALASVQFDTRLRDRADPEGVVQSAYASFFQRQGRGSFELGDWDRLWSLLTVITVRKCWRRRDYLTAECRDPGREARSDPASGPGRLEAIDRDPTPVEAAILAEVVQGLLDGLDRPEREIVELSLMGHTAPEVAAELGRSQRTVRRVRERVKDQLLRSQGDGGPA